MAVTVFLTYSKKLPGTSGRLSVSPACKSLVPFLLTCLLLTGCTRHLSGDQSHEAATGAAIGAVALGGAAALAHASPAGVVAAGAGGAVAGYLIASRSLPSHHILSLGGSVLQTGDCVTVLLPSDSLFEINTARFQENVTPVLASTVRILNDYPQNDVVISGNSSGFGTDSREIRLTARRASRVAHWLQQNGLSRFRESGMERRCEVITGNGDRFPIASPLTLSGVRTNSRIQISACPPASTLRADNTGSRTENISDSQGYKTLSAAPAKNF